MVLEIAIDTNRLDSDIKELNEMRQHLWDEKSRLEEHAAELREKWSGNASNAFEDIFRRDCSSLEELALTMNNFLEQMTFAKNEYSQCMDKVDQLVERIRI